MLLFKSSWPMLCAALGIVSISANSLSNPLRFYDSPEFNVEISALETLNQTLQVSVEYGFERFAAGGIELFLRESDHLPHYGIGARFELHRNGSFETGLYSALFFSNQFTPTSAKHSLCNPNTFNMGLAAGYQWFMPNGLNASIGGGYEAINDHLTDTQCQHDSSDNAPVYKGRGFGEFRIGFAL